MLKGAACFTAVWCDKSERIQTDNTRNYTHPLALTAAPNDTEVFYYHQAMSQPDKDKFVDAMIKRSMI